MSRAVFADDEPLLMAATDLRPDRPIREGSSSRSLHQEGGLPELFDAIRWRWRPTTLIALLFFLGATIYVERLPSQYDGTALIAVSPDPQSRNSGADTVRVLEPEDRGDVRMVELRQELRFTLEARQALPVVGEERRQHLDRDFAPEL